MRDIIRAFNTLNGIIVWIRPKYICALTAALDESVITRVYTQDGKSYEVIATPSEMLAFWRGDG